MILRYLLLYISLYSVDVIATSQTIEIYSWKDKSEEIHYSQFPPEDKVKSFEITIEQMPLPILKDEKLKNWSIEIDKYITEKKN